MLFRQLPGLIPVKTSRLRLALLVFVAVSGAALAAPPPLPPPLPPPPLPAGAQPGGAQPIMPPPSIPVPETNLDLSVPPTYERPLSAEEGARVFVKKFVVTGVIGDRKAGINPADIQAAVDARFADIEKLVEAERLKKQNLEKQGPEGFTPDEQEKIIKFMSGAVKTQSADQQQQQYQQFIQELMLERLSRLQGLTIGQLQQMADAVTKYYHDKGYFLARAVIPAQEIKDGVVNIRVLEGRLEKTITDGNKRYSDTALAAPFKPLLGELVTVGRTEDALLTLSHYPGLSAAGVFRPGTDIGTTDIVVNVQNEREFDGSARYDNDGTQFTGRRRLVGVFDWNNMTGGADLLQVTALKTFSPSNSTFGDIRYQHPVYDAYDQLAFDISRNSFDVGGAAANSAVAGISKIGLVSLEHDFQYSREAHAYGTVDWSRKRADINQRGALFNRDDLAELGFQFNYDSVNLSSNTISTSYARIEHGLPGLFGAPTTDDLNKLVNIAPKCGGNGTSTSGLVTPSRTAPVGAPNSGCREPASSEFNKYELNYQVYKALPSNQGLKFRFDGQYSPNLLTSLEQYVIGGPSNVRAVPQSQFLTDTGMFGSVEYSVRAPGFSDKHAFGNYTWGQVLNFHLFEDASTGVLHRSASSALARVSAEGTGVGIEFSIPGSLTANLQWAHLNGGARVNPKNANDPTNIKDSSQTWFDVTYNF